MTRKRAIEVLKAWDLNWSDEFTTNEFEQAFAMAIKALEQKPILDKIRAEIMSKDGLEEALEIIDKYRAESEGK